MNDLEELKSLLFGAEKEALESIQERVQKPETRAVDVADVLPEAVRLSHRKDGELVKTLRDPVGQCLTQSIHETPQEFADALYPVMGPAIRKSISHTLRAFAQQINQTVEQSLSAKGIRWRFEAWRAGVPFGEYVVQKSLLYRIEQAYLISRENGLLISHVHLDASRIKDSDAVSAMFTAIQDFVKESFSPDRSGRLETADLGDFTLWAVHGPHALLVCVIRGVPPRSMRAELSAILERIHFRYGEKIRVYSGDTATMQGVEEELGECLGLQAQQPKDKGGRRWSTPIVVLLLGMVAAILYLGVAEWQLRKQQQRLTDVLDNTPGFYVASVERDGKRFIVRGLRDPLAATVADVADRADLDRDKLAADFRPFQSLDAEIAYLRTIDQLNLPDTVVASAGDDVVMLAGLASQDWIDRVRRRFDTPGTGWAANLDGVESLDMRKLRADVDAAREAQFSFVEGTTLSSTDTERLQAHAATLRELAGAAERLGASLKISILGQTDGSGSQADNEDLAQRRSAIAAEYLLQEGIDADLISRSGRVSSVEFGPEDPQLRRVSVLLALRPPRDLLAPALE